MIATLENPRLLVHGPSPWLRPVFSPDGQLMATLSQAGALVLWDVESLSPVTQTVAQPSRSYTVQGYALEWSPSDLIAALYANELIFYCGLNLEVQTRWLARHNSLMGFGGGGSWMAQARDSITITDIASTKTMCFIPPRWDTEFCEYTHMTSDPVGNTVLFIDDGGYEDIGMATEGPFNDKLLTLVEVPSNRTLRSKTWKRGKNEGVWKLHFDVWRNCYWIGTYQGWIEGWDTLGNTLSRRRLGQAIVSDIACSKTSMAALLQPWMSVAPPTLVVWNDAGERIEKTLTHPAEWVALSPDGQWLLLPELEKILFYPLSFPSEKPTHDGGRP